MEAEHDYVFVVNSGGLRGGSFIFAQLSLMIFLTDTLKSSHASAKMEFMW